MVRSATVLAAVELTAVAMLQTLLQSVDGHIYMMSPRSRNFFYTPVFQP